MSRFALALAVAAVPALAAANAPPPDHFSPCIGKQAGDPCYEAGCTCVAVPAQEGCPADAGVCLSCERPGPYWCGPTNYSNPLGGCHCSAPAGASLAGLLGLFLLARRRRPRAGRAGPPATAA